MSESKEALKNFGTCKRDIMRPERKKIETDKPFFAETTSGASFVPHGKLEKTESFKPKNVIRALSEDRDWTTEGRSNFTEHSLVGNRANMPVKRT